MRVNTIHSPWYYLAVGIATFGLCAFILHTFYHESFAEKKTIYMQSKLNEALIQYTALDAIFNSRVQTLFEHFINTPEITALMRDATLADETRRTLVRNRLYEKLLPLYNSMRTHHIRHLHFHLPGAISFLRFHRPDRFGDDLNSVRTSLVKINETRQALFGFDAGPLFNGFRHIFPLFYQNIFVGTVEISYPLNALREQAIERFPAGYDYILKADIVRAHLWKEELERYKVSELSSAFYRDEDARSRLWHTPTISYEIIRNINVSLPVDTGQLLAKGNAIIQDTVVEEQEYLAAFIPIHNITGKLAGYYITYFKENNLALMRNNFFTTRLMFVAVMALGIMLFILLLVTRDRQHHIRLLGAATDPLTGIANRDRLGTILKDDVINARRRGEPLSVIFFDIDYFRGINNTLGLETGNRALVELTALVKRSLRPDDHFARWGGEEFVIILMCTTRDEATAIAETLRETIRRHRFTFGTLTCSFGVTALRDDENDAALLKRVDTMLYPAKKEGRNTVNVL